MRRGGGPNTRPSAYSGGFGRYPASQNFTPERAGDPGRRQFQPHQEVQPKNPAIKWLTERFVDRLDGMVGQMAADSSPATNPLEVGAGEGVISLKLKERFGTAVGLDLPDAELREEWRSRPGPHYLHGDAENLPFVDKQFDLLVACQNPGPRRSR